MTLNVNSDAPLATSDANDGVRSLLTFLDEPIDSKESFSRSGVVGLKDEFKPLVDGDDGSRDLASAQSVLEVLH